MKKTLTLFFFGAMLCAFPGETEARLDFARLKDFKVKAHVNEQNAEPPPGTSVRQTEDGIELNYVFPTAKHDALMIEFPMNVPDADAVTVELTAAQPGHRPYLVVVDAGEEFVDVDAGRQAEHRRLEGDLDISASRRRRYRHDAEVVARHSAKRRGTTANRDVDGWRRIVVDRDKAIWDIEDDGDLGEVHRHIAIASDEDGEQKGAHEGDEFLGEIGFQSIDENRLSMRRGGGFV